MNVAYLIKIIIPAYCTFFIPCKNTVGYSITSQSHGVCILVHNEPVQWIGSEEYLCEILYIYFVAFWTSFKKKRSIIHFLMGAGRSSEVERSLMVRWVVRSILHGVDPLSYFSFQPVLHDWCNKGRGMCYPVCGMVHIKEPLLLIDKSSLCGGSGFPFSLSEWSLTICLTP